MFPRWWCTKRLNKSNGLAAANQHTVVDFVLKSCTHKVTKHNRLTRGLLLKRRLHWRVITMCQPRSRNFRSLWLCKHAITGNLILTSLNVGARNLSIRTEMNSHELSLYNNDTQWFVWKQNSDIRYRNNGNRGIAVYNCLVSNRLY